MSLILLGVMAHERVEGRKEMFYLTTYSTHFIYGLHGVRHMVKDHSDSEKRNSLSD